MPTYDYRCDRCGATFERWQSMKDDALTVCPLTDGPAECVAPGHGPVKKVFSSVGISFKGSGFYKNDHGANAESRRSDTASSNAGDSSTTPPSGDSSSGDSSSGSSSSSSSSSATTSSSSTD